MDIHFAHHRNKSTERFIHTNARLATGEKCGIAGAGKVCHVQDRAKEKRPPPKPRHPPSKPPQLQAEAIEGNEKSDS
jgi:hypothetical protein